MVTIKIMNEAYEQVMYPSVLITEGYEVVVTTTLRMEHEGKWYLCNFLNRHRDPKIADNGLSIILEILHKEVYKIHQIGRVGTDIINSFGENMFELDDNQEPEVDRISRLIEEMKI